MMERVVAALRELAEVQARQAVALEELARAHWETKSTSPKGEPSEHREPPKTKAIRLLIEMGTGNITAVAKAAGVTRKTLYAWPETKRVIERLRAVEAWEVRNPRAVRHDEL